MISVTETLCVQYQRKAKDRSEKSKYENHIFVSKIPKVRDTNPKTDASIIAYTPKAFARSPEGKLVRGLSLP
jgi:hypothetical protein